MNLMITRRRPAFVSITFSFPLFSPSRMSLDVLSLDERREIISRSLKMIPLGYNSFAELKTNPRERLWATSVDPKQGIARRVDDGPTGFEWF